MSWLNAGAGKVRMWVPEGLEGHRGWRVGSRGKEGMVRVATLTSLEKRSNSEYISIGPETMKNWKEDSFSKFCASGRRLVR